MFVSASARNSGMMSVSVSMSRSISQNVACPMIFVPVKLTCALVTFISTSPLAAATMVSNFSQTPPKRPRRLFSARASRKFLTVALEPAPDCLASSATTAALSSLLRVGALRMVESLGSFWMMLCRVAMALEVGSRLEDLEAAVYWELTH